MTFMSEDFVLLRMFLLGGAKEQAEYRAALFLSSYSINIVDYKEGSPLLISILEQESDPFFLVEIAPSPYTQQYFPGYNGKKVIDRILDILKGFI